MDLSNASHETYTATIGVSSGGGYSRAMLAQMALPVPLVQVALIGDLFRDFQLIQPLVISFEQADGKVISSDDVFYMFGEGVTCEAAVWDYLSTLSEYYNLLESYDDAPSVELFSFLQTYLRPKSNAPRQSGS